MAAYHVFITSELHQLLHGKDSGVTRDLLRRAKIVEGRAKRYVRVDTGRLRGSITTELRVGGEGYVARVGTNVYYAPWVETGTGIYGGQFGGGGARIVPVTARALTFTPKMEKYSTALIPKRKRKMVYVRWVRGQQGVHFLKKALVNVH